MKKPNVRSIQQAVQWVAKQAYPIVSLSGVRSIYDNDVSMGWNCGEFTPSSASYSASRELVDERSRLSAKVQLPAEMI